MGSMLIRDSLSSTTTADNATATVTIAAPSNGQNIYITSISASFGAAAIKLLTLSDGSTIGNYHVHNQRDIVFSSPIKIKANTAAVIALAASGTGGVLGAITVNYFVI